MMITYDWKRVLRQVVIYYSDLC